MRTSLKINFLKFWKLTKGLQYYEKHSFEKYSWILVKSKFDSVFSLPYFHPLLPSTGVALKANSVTTAVTNSHSRGWHDFADPQKPHPRELPLSDVSESSLKWPILRFCLHMTWLSVHSVWTIVSQCACWKQSLTVVHYYSCQKQWWRVELPRGWLKVGPEKNWGMRCLQRAEERVNKLLGV